MISAQDILKALERHTNVLLYGPPGTGKSHLMKEVETLFLRKHNASVGPRHFINTAAERRSFSEAPAASAFSRWVTFHQGYSYEDFVIGLRPKASSTPAMGIALEARAGALLELAAYSRQGHGLMLIDEINRGNASRIFGEFITLMEADKRLREDGTASEATVTVTLPYLAMGETVKLETGVELAREFAMPRRVYTLASMNSVDKSIAPIDAAIRRRFYVFNLQPAHNEFEAASGQAKAQHDVARLAVAVIEHINRGIGIYLGPDYMLGQYYLPLNPTLGEMAEAEAKRRLVDCWRRQILPQVLELFQSRPGVCKNILSLDKLRHSGVQVVAPSDDEADEGASSFLLNVERQESDPEIYEYLVKLAQQNHRTGQVGIDKPSVAVDAPSTGTDPTLANDEQPRASG